MDIQPPGNRDPFARFAPPSEPEEEKFLFAMKALTIVDGIPSSPSRGTKWPHYGYIFASCQHCHQAVIETGCTCGVYASVSKMIVDGYLRSYEYQLSAVVLVAACGNTEVWSSGWRAQAAQAHYVVDYPRADKHLRQGALGATMASRYFDLPIVTYDFAVSIIRHSWEDCGYELLPRSRTSLGIGRNTTWYSDYYVHMGFEKKHEGRKSWSLDERAG